MKINDTTRRLLLGTGLVATGVAALGTAHRAVARFFVDMALDRQCPSVTPGAAQKLSGEDLDPEVRQAVKEASKRLWQREAQVVEITAQDGIPLVGHWIEGRDPRRAVVAMHGWRSTWAHDFGLAADFLLDNGCSVLFAEQRGQGSSGGEYMGFGLLERYDCLSWVNWVIEHTGGTLPVYLDGVSMGASTVLMAAGLDLPENVKGIVADCGYTSPRAIWEHIAKNNLHLSYGLYDATVNDICRQKIQLGSDDYSCVDAMKQCRVPVLFVHGTDDHFVPVEMTYENYKACAAPKRLLIVPGAEHGLSYWVDRQSYEAEVLRFWEDFDQS